MSDLKLEIGPYESTLAGLREWDPRSPAVAALLIDAITSLAPSLKVQHVGSTAIPGCAGKGIIDLQVDYQPGDLDTATKALAQLGLEPQSGPNRFPDDRPMFHGSVTHGGTVFRIHAHVVCASWPEAREMPAFRDRLVSDPSLVESYLARKRTILAETSDPMEYTRAKTTFVEGVIGVQSATWTGAVERIYIGSEATKPMTELWQVRVLEGKGLEGDRYAEGRGTFSNKPATGRHVTLVEAEAIEAVAKDKEIPFDVTRRNIVTRGVPLNHLVGKEFTVGEVVLRGMRLCEPCSHMSRLGGDKELKTAFLHRAGLRAEIVKPGTIFVKDRIAPIEH